jgi:isocitrate lyase
MRNASLIIAALPLLLSGCIVGTVAKTAVDVATLPVKAVSAGVDAATTSQKEADEKRGREMRKQDEERGKQVRLAQERCRKGKPLPTDDCAAVAQR